MNSWDVLWSTYLWAGLAILVYVLFAWLVSLVQRDTSVVDIFWGVGFVMVSVVYFVLTEGVLIRQVLLLSLVAIWGLRLSIYIGIRNHGRPEDPRYRAWRERHGSSWPVRSFVTVFLFQGLLMWVISIPLLAAQLPSDHSKLMWLDYAGVVLWLVGFLFEAIGDWQLFRFKQNPSNHNKVLDMGLWRYTRHPNYFGEFLIWWGYGLIALTSGLLWVLVGPVVISTLVMKFSGVGMLEKVLRDSIPGYRDYIKMTSSFFPWPRRVTRR